MTSHTSLFVAISTDSGKVINGRSKRGPCEGPNFKQVPQFLKSNRISLAYGLTSNKDQIININKSCFVFLLYRGICRLCDIFGRFGGRTAFAPLDSPLKVMAPRPRLMRICVHLQNLKTISALIISKKVHANSPLHRQISTQI